MPLSAADSWLGGNRAAWYELAAGLEWSLFLSGTLLLLLGVFGVRFSSQFARSRRLLLVAGVILIALSVLPGMVESFQHAFETGAEIRRRQGR